MKTLMLLTVLVVLVAAASAIWSGDRGDDTQGGYRGSGGPRGDYESYRSWKAGRDRERENDWGSRHRGGRHRGSHRHDKYWRTCSCRTQCEGNTGTKLIGCFTNRASYLQCKDTNCSVEACPDNQLFNVTTSSCEACPAGFRVDANKRRCVCDQGTTFDYRTRACVPCPTGATITPDKCYCNNSVLHKSENTCKPCPEGSTKNKRGCFCNDAKAFFSFESFSCQQCPGVWVSRSDGRHTRRSRRPVEVCECQGVNQIFNRWTVACMTCPDDSVATTKRGKSYCDCTAIGQRYDWKVGKCANLHDNDDDDDDDNDDDNDDRDTD